MLKANYNASPLYFLKFHSQQVIFDFLVLQNVNFYRCINFLKSSFYLTGYRKVNWFIQNVDQS